MTVTKSISFFFVSLNIFYSAEIKSAVKHRHLSAKHFMAALYPVLHTFLNRDKVARIDWSIVHRSGVKLRAKKIIVEEKWCLTTLVMIVVLRVTSILSYIRKMRWMAERKNQNRHKTQVVINSYFIFPQQEIEPIQIKVMPNQWMNEWINEWIKEWTIAKNKDFDLRCYTTGNWYHTNCSLSVVP